MKAQNLKKLQNFVGQVCTILTTGVCKNNFTDAQFPDFFLGIVESLDEDGVFSKHPMTGCMNYYSWNHIVGIFQEQVIEENDPKFKDIVEEIKNKSPEQKPEVFPVDPKTENPQFLDAELMANLTKQAQEMQKTMTQRK